MVVHILLTAAVDPNVSGPIALRDPEARLTQYKESIRSWSGFARAAGAKLHVLETTGARTDDLLEGVRPVDRPNIAAWVTTTAPDVAARGKGAAEFAAVREYLTGGSLLSPDETYYKVTGRLTLANPAKCIVSLREDEVRARMTLNRSFADTRLVGAGHSAWRVLLSEIDQSVDDAKGVYAEHAVAAVIARNAALGLLTLTRFPSRPRYEGSSGTTAHKYGPIRQLLGAAIAHPFEEILVRISERKQV